MSAQDRFPDVDEEKLREISTQKQRLLVFAGWFLLMLTSLVVAILGVFGLVPGWIGMFCTGMIAAVVLNVGMSVIQSKLAQSERNGLRDLVKETASDATDDWDQMMQ